ncbi:MAG: TlpA family protein disulfide reductase [Deltaproteobacteria bacterium]|nr:TlpA family protein disulfide reductase [Deltaproteobacteria bacterium]MCW5801889.1 TlpA family protein disulfide reductase [Deltaproteobacteria bacterium]
MADAPEDLPVATALPPRSQRQPRAIVVDPKVLIVGGTVAVLGVVVLALFLWMVPHAAARESISACRGLGGYNAVNKALCPGGGRSCSLPQPAPDFEAFDHTGKKVKLSELRGKVVLLNFWASWCGVCSLEKPMLADMARELGGDNFEVVALASDHNWTNVIRALVSSLAKGTPLPQVGPDGQMAPTEEAKTAFRGAFPDGLPFRVLVDPPDDDGTMGKITKSWGISAVPESALIDKKGQIRAYFVNKRDWESPVAQTCLRSVIDE